MEDVLISFKTVKLAKEKGFDEWCKSIIYKLKFRKMVEKNLVPGTKVIVVSDTCIHGIKIGTTLTVKGLNTDKSGYLVQESGNYFKFSDLRLVIVTIEDVKNGIRISRKISYRCTE
jgi:hypothetical protein